MSDNVLSRNEMCRREGVSLQRGMNLGLGGNHSVILMCVRPNAPYRDRLEDGGTTLIYEGHNQPKTTSCPNPKLVDQPGALPSGTVTQNGKFYQAARSSKMANDHLSGFASMRRCAQAYGHTMGSFILWMPGKSATSIGRSTNLSSLLSRVMKTSLSQSTWTQNDVELFHRR